MANFVRKSASSNAESPPPTTYTSFSRKNEASQVAQAETPRPLCCSSDSIPSQRALAPVATMTARERYSSSPTQTRNGCSEKSTRVTSSVTYSAPNRSAWRRKSDIISGPHDPVGVAGVVLDVAGDHQLAAPGEALDDEGLEVGARGVERGRIAGGAAADDDQLTDVLVAQEVLLSENLSVVVNVIGRLDVPQV